MFDTYALPREERLKLHPEIQLWQPASGYRNKWRLVRETSRGLEELCGNSGRRILLQSIGSASEKAIELNG
jgi:hypothetical protein